MALRRIGIFSIGLALLALAMVRPASSGTDLDELVITTQLNTKANGPGCNAVSVFRLSDTTPLYRSTDEDPANRTTTLAATTDFGLVLALTGNPVDVGPTYAPSLIRLLGAVADRSRWATSRPVVGARFGYDRGLAVMPDDDTLLVDMMGPSDDDDPFAPWDGAGLAKYCLSEIDPDGAIGPLRGFYPDTLVPSQIFPSADGIHAHVVSAAGRSSFLVAKIDARTMQAVAAPVFLPPSRNAGDDVQPLHEYPGAISPDERFLITHRQATDDEVAVVDLLERRAWTIPLKGLCLPRGCGEVAFSHGPANQGLLAIRGSHELAIFEFRPKTQLRKLSRWPVRAHDEIPYSPVAWSGDGSHVLVGMAVESGPDLLVLRVSDGGRILTSARAFRTCETRVGINRPVSILTANRKLAHVVPAVPCAPPTPTPTLTPLPTHTRSPSPTPRPTYTASATSTSTTRQRPTLTPLPSPDLTPIFRARLPTSRTPRALQPAAHRFGHRPRH